MGPRAVLPLGVSVNPGGGGPVGRWMFAPDPPLLPHFFCSGLGMSEDSRDLSPSSQVRGWGVCWAFCVQSR